MRGYTGSLLYDSSVVSIDRSFRNVTSSHPNLSWGSLAEEISWIEAESDLLWSLLAEHALNRMVEVS